MKTTTKRTLQPIELTVKEMKQAGGGIVIALLLPAVQSAREAAR